MDEEEMEIWGYKVMVQFGCRRVLEPIRLKHEHIEDYSLRGLLAIVFEGPNDSKITGFGCEYFAGINKACNAQLFEAGDELQLQHIVFKVEAEGGLGSRYDLVSRADLPLHQTAVLLPFTAGSEVIDVFNLLQTIETIALPILLMQDWGHRILS